MQSVGAGARSAVVALPAGDARSGRIGQAREAHHGCVIRVLLAVRAVSISPDGELAGCRSRRRPPRERADRPPYQESLQGQGTLETRPGRVELGGQAGGAPRQLMAFP